jgi:DNA-binding response OmpR family regulator
MKILVIEDDELLAKALKTTLEKEGFAVDYVTDGEVGQRRLEVHHENYDLVVLDLILPNRLGFDICKSLREKGITIPILVLTGKSTTDDKVFLLNCGADDYLTKPFSTEELLARVRAILRRPKQVSQNEVQLGDITLNLSTRRIYRSGKEIFLTLKEFGILEYLMRHPNQAVTRDEILDHVWDFNFASFSNIVDVHINKLRKKIGNGEGGIQLETIRGVGYRFKV